MSAVSRLENATQSHDRRIVVQLRVFSDILDVLFHRVTVHLLVVDVQRGSAYQLAWLC
jgi:hypothetical protein